MKKEEAITLTLECLSRNGAEAEERYKLAFVAQDPEWCYRFTPQWAYDRMQEYRHAERALRKGDVGPAVDLLNSLMESGRRVFGFDRKFFQRGKYPILCLRDGLLGIDTPSLPDLPPPKRTKKDRVLDKILDKILGL